MSEAPRIAVVTFPGSNDDGDAMLALELLGAAPVRSWHGDFELPEGAAGVVLPGGFSYGDYLRCGAIARFAPVMEAVGAFAASGRPVLGICNGFQILCEAGLLPGVLRPNRQQQFVCADVTVTVESTSSAFAGEWVLGQELVIPVKHGEGSWYGDPQLVEEIEARGQIAFRYAEDVNGVRFDSTRRKTSRHTNRRPSFRSIAPGRSPASQRIWKPLQMPRTAPPCPAKAATDSITGEKRAIAPLLR